MRAAPRAFGVLWVVIATTAHAVEAEGRGNLDLADSKPVWDLAVTAYPTMVRGGENYTSAVVTANRGPLHLEGRVNYESIGARSAFVGWTFSGADEISWEITPMAGGAWGTTKAFMPGLVATLAWRRFDFYTEIEYVHDRNDGSSSYIYSWNEFGFRPVEWFRLGLVAQRTRVYGGDRDVHPGPFAQVTWRHVTIGGYWFNPGSADQVTVVSIGAAF